MNSPMNSMPPTPPNHRNTACMKPYWEAPAASPSTSSAPTFAPT